MLTRLDLGCCLAILKVQLPSLTHLTSSATVEATLLRPNLEEPVLLSVLDAPNWRFTAHYILGFDYKSCTTLRCRILAMEDHQVVPFLSQKVSAATRLNMRVSLTVLPTGALIDGGLRYDYENLWIMIRWRD